MPGGSITIRKDIAGTLAVTITCTTGATAVFYTDAALTTAATFPASITADATYYTRIDDSYIISVKRNGYELASNPDGSTVTVALSGGRAFSFSPSVDERSALSHGELAATIAGTGTSLGAWTAFTPTLAGFTLGDGTVTGKYSQAGKTVSWNATMTFGSTSAAAAASPTLTIPVTAASATNAPVGAEFYDVSTTTYYDAVGRYSSTTVVTLAIPGASGVWTTPSTTAPFTWATGDMIIVSGTYEAA